jgi:ferredoxin
MRNMAERWRLEVDHGVCVGSGMCVGHAPAAFELNSARQSSPKVAEVDSDEAVLEAAENCPAEAITITDAVTGAAVFPPTD